MYQILNHALKENKPMESLMHLWVPYDWATSFSAIITPYHAPSQNPCSSPQQSLALRIQLGIFSFLPYLFSGHYNLPMLWVSMPYILSTKKSKIWNGLIFSHSKLQSVQGPVCRLVQVSLVWICNKKRWTMKYLSDAGISYIEWKWPVGIVLSKTQTHHWNPKGTI